MLNSLVLEDEKGRSDWRYALGNKRQILIQGFPNRATLLSTSPNIKDLLVNLVNWNILVARGKESKI